MLFSAFSTSIKPHVFTVLITDMAEIFDKSLTCVACWGNAKNQWCKTAGIYIMMQKSSTKTICKFPETVKG